MNRWASVIDYFISDTVDDTLDYCELDPDINLTDLLLSGATLFCPVASLVAEITKEPEVDQLRWDHADLLFYYNTTMSLLYPLYYEC